MPGAVLVRNVSRSCPSDECEQIVRERARFSRGYDVVLHGIGDALVDPVVWLPWFAQIVRVKGA